MAAGGNALLQVIDREVLTYKGLKLDPFQIESIKLLDEGHSVIVSAPTGVGKTLVADYLIDRTVANDSRVIYTAPIKALSNQKFKEFKRQFGPDAVGIMTGDVVINPEAQVLIMTTEIFRNMLLIDPRRVYGTSYVILDEIHFIADEDRGSVWEESLIFLPPDMRFLGLSATIPNVNELAEWVTSIRSDDIKVVTKTERVVPLTHLLYEKGMGLGTFDDLRAYKDRVLKWAEKREQETGQYFDTKSLFPETTHVDLIEAISNKYLPCLYFVFSRKQCELKAAELAQKHTYLSFDETHIVEQIFDAKIDSIGTAGMPSVKKMREILRCGIGVHHAGLLPALKEIVEELFERRLIKVLYCTETFAVGINMPVKAVCFDSWQKYDGVQFRDLSAQEYFQMSGRAGRRGIDPEGFAFTLINMRYFDSAEFPRFDANDVDDLKSRFKLSYNTVLNLVNAYTQENIRRILDGNFAIYQLKRERQRLIQAQQEGQQRKKELSGFTCENCRDLSCPIEYRNLEKQIAGNKIKIRYIPKKAWRRKKMIQRQISADVERLGRVRPKNCDENKITACSNSTRELKMLNEELSILKSQIDELDPENVFHKHFSKMVEVLTRLDYINPDRTLAPRGQIAAEIHVQELLVTELIFSGILHELDIPELAGLCVAIDYEPRKEEYYSHAPFVEFDVERLVESIVDVETEVLGRGSVVYNPHAARLAYMWAADMEFHDLMKRTQLAEGDVVLAFRRAIDLMRQIRQACRQDESLSAKLGECIEKMDRDVVKVDL